MREKLVVKNSIITSVCQISDIILGFVLRKLFIVHIGVGLLGVSSTFTAILSTLSLAELGFESAIIFSLYKPLSTGNKGEVEDIIIILKRIYEIVGWFILIAGVAFSPFLPKLLTGIEVNSYIYIVFYIQLLGTAVTYFLGAKRTLLFALQMDYIRNIYISIFKILATVLQIIFIVTSSSYIAYVVIGVAQNFITNYFISRYVDKHYNYDFSYQKINKPILRKIFTNVKDIFWGKIAGFIYSSTDSIVISVYVGTISVGYLANYTQILYQLRTVLNNILNSTKPIIGHFLSEQNDKEHTYEVLCNYTFVRYIFSSMLFIPGFVLVDTFISAWLGPEYNLPLIISVLLTADLFIHFIHGALVDYIAGLGFFSYDKIISICGAICNIVISIFLVQRIGIAGVLVGTVISQSFFWISRSVIIFKYYFNDLKSKFVKYWIKSAGYTMAFIINCFAGRYILNLISLNDSYLKFLVGGFLCCSLIISVNFLFYHKTHEFNYLLKIIKKMLGKVLIKYNKNDIN